MNVSYFLSRPERGTVLVVPTLLTSTFFFVIASNEIIRTENFTGVFSKSFASVYFFSGLLPHLDTRLTQSRSNKLHRHAGRYFGPGASWQTSLRRIPPPPREGREREGSLSLIKKSNHRDESVPAVDGSRKTRQEFNFGDANGATS